MYFMPPARFMLLPFFVNAKESNIAEFPPLERHGLSELMSVHPEYIDIHFHGPYLVCYRAVCCSADACPAFFLNGREIPATRDCGKNTCGSAVLFLNDTAKSSTLSLCLCTDISEPVKGFILISII